MKKSFMRFMSTACEASVASVSRQASCEGNLLQEVFDSTKPKWVDLNRRKMGERYKDGR
jgi:hypothetical protein